MGRTSLRVVVWFAMLGLVTCSSDPGGSGGTGGSTGGSTGDTTGEPGICDDANDFECDEAKGTGLCAEGTDVNDCCPDAQNGICEEMGMGGECLPGTDFYDCGTCPEDLLGDLDCDEADGTDICPDGSDPLDCCGYHDGNCGEISMGGTCPDGSDFFDCGYCPEEWLGDGFCDEPEQCPVGTDTADCMG